MRKYPLEPKTDSNKLLAKKVNQRKENIKKLKIVFINVDILYYYIINENHNN